jgi:hypothetical protein
VASSVAGRLRKLFGKPEPLCAGLHLLADIAGLDPSAVPKNNEVIEKIRALTHGTFGTVPDRFNGDFPGLLDQLLCNLAVPRLKKPEGARIYSFGSFAKRPIEALQFSGGRSA